MNEIDPGQVLRVVTAACTLFSYMQKVVYYVDYFNYMYQIHFTHLSTPLPKQRPQELTFLY